MGREVHPSPGGDNHAPQAQAWRLPERQALWGGAEAQRGKTTFSGLPSKLLVGLGFNPGLLTQSPPLITSSPSFNPAACGRGCVTGSPGACGKQLPGHPWPCESESLGVQSAFLICSPGGSIAGAQTTGVNTSEMEGQLAGKGRWRLMMAAVPFSCAEESREEPL